MMMYNYTCFDIQVGDNKNSPVHLTELPSNNCIVKRES